jgi:glycosyltransferase involved in cell wall biosynthesis
VKILHVVPSYLPAWRYGGPIRSVHGLARAQAAAGDEVAVFTTDADGAGRLDVPTGRAVDREGVAVQYFPVGSPRRLFRSPSMGRALAARIGEFDAVHLHSAFLWPTLAAARAAESAGVRYFVSPRGMLVGDLVRARGALRKRLWIGLVERRTLARAAGIVVQSELERRELEALGLALAPVDVIPNGLDPAEIGSPRDEVAAPELVASAARGPFVLFLGRLSWKKGIERLIEAMARVPDARLIVAGNDDEGLRPGLEQSARKAGLAARVEFAGEVSGASKRLLLERAAVFCLPSRSENFGLAALEALAAGRPVVVTPQVGLASLPEVAGALVVASPEPASLAHAIRGLLEDPERARRLGERAAEVALGHFAWASIAARIREVYSRR